MGCACNKGVGAKGFIHTTPEGKMTTTRTEIEAKALVIRKGGSYTPKR